MRPALFLALAVIALDQASKAWLIGFMADRANATLEILPFFNLVMVWNSGVSFGLFSGDPEETRWILAVVNLVVAGGLAVWLARAPEPRIRFALALVIGGAVGNAIDRVAYGAVADFFDLHLATWHWPAFNVADMGITFGVIGLLLDSLFGSSEPSKRQRHDH